MYLEIQRETLEMQKTLEQFLELLKAPEIRDPRNVKRR